MGIVALLIRFTLLHAPLLSIATAVARAVELASDKVIGFIAVATVIVTVAYSWSRFEIWHRRTRTEISDSTKKAAVVGYSAIHLLAFLLNNGVPPARPEDSVGTVVAMALAIGVAFVTAVIPGMMLGEVLARDKGSGV